MNEHKVSPTATRLVFASEDARRKVMEFARGTIARMPAWKREAYGQEMEYFADMASFADMARLARGDQ